MIDERKLINDLEVWQSRLKDSPEEDILRIFLKTTVDKIKAQPVIEEKRWIPVTEKLPENYRNVLVSYVGKAEHNEGITGIAISFTIPYQSKEEGRWQNGFDWKHPFEWLHENYEVVAWMPLPEPYEEPGGNHK